MSRKRLEKSLEKILKKCLEECPNFDKTLRTISRKYDLKNFPVKYLEQSFTKPP